MSGEFEVGSDVVEDFAAAESFEAAKDVFLGETFGESSLHVGDGSRVVRSRRLPSCRVPRHESNMRPVVHKPWVGSSKKAIV